MSVTINLTEGNKVTIKRQDPISLTLEKKAASSVSITQQANVAISLQNKAPSFISIIKPGFSGSVTLWGSIAGTVTDQTDLVDYIAEQIADIPTPATPTLQSVTDAGAITTNDITIGTTVLRSGSYLNVKPVSNYGIIVRNSGDDNKYISMGVPGDYGFIKYKENTGSAVTINSTGVGIGTTAPSALLEIKSSSTNDFLKLTTTGSSASPVKLIFEKSAVEQGVIEFNRNGDFEIYNTDNDGGVLISGSGSATADMYINRLGNVGIGTTAPTEKLEVVGKAIIRKSGTATPHGDTDFLVTDATAALSTAQMQILGGNNASSILYFSDTDAYNVGGIKYKHSDNSMRLQVNSSEKVIITSTGNVGIGTTAPTEKLHVDGNIRTSFSTGIGVGTNTVYSNSVNINNSGQYRIGNAEFISKSVNDMSIYQGRMWVTNSRNVGIGTTAPDSKLTVAQSADSNGIKIIGFDDRSADNLTIHINSSGSGEILSNTGVRVNSLSGPTSFLYNGSLMLQIASTSVNVRDDVELAFGNDKDYSIGYNTADDTFTIVDGSNLGSNTRLLINSSGNVGIGTTAPAQKLDVSGNLNVSGFIFGGNEIRVGSAQWLRFGTKPTLWADPTTVILRGGSGSDAFKYEDSSGNEKLRITSTGNVGIGTTAPANLLHIVDATDPTFKIGDASNRNITLRGGTSSRTPNISSYSGLGLGGSDGAFHAFINNAGNVGIGTTAPTSLLHVKDNVNGRVHIEAGTSGGTSNSTARLIIEDNTSNAIQFLTPAGSFNSSIYFGDADNSSRGLINYNHSTDQLNLESSNGILLRLGGQNILQVDSSYNVGIGTTSPDSKLHVSATSGIAFKVNPNNVDKEWYIDTTNPDHLKKEGNLILNADPTGVHTSTFIGLNVDGSNKMRIQHDGTVGIGTTSPTSNLHINGTAMRQLRLEVAGGPSSNTDTAGGEGDFAYDDLYLYIKTGSGWGRVALDFAF